MKQSKCLNNIIDIALNAHVSESPILPMPAPMYAQLSEAHTLLGARRVVLRYFAS